MLKPSTRAVVVLFMCFLLLSPLQAYAAWPLFFYALTIPAELPRHLHLIQANLSTAIEEALGNPRASSYMYSYS